jgi:hypothetical protein
MQSYAYIKNRTVFFFITSVASSVKSREIIAYFFFPWVFGITCGFSRDFAENREIWRLDREKASKIVSVTIKS